MSRDPEPLRPQRRAMRIGKIAYLLIGNKSFPLIRASGIMRGAPANGDWPEEQNPHDRQRDEVRWRSC